MVVMHKAVSYLMIVSIICTSALTNFAEALTNSVLKIDASVPFSEVKYIRNMFNSQFFRISVFDESGFSYPISKHLYLDAQQKFC